MSKTLKSLADNAYWREEDARGALDELARSGLPLETFAEKHGLGAARLRRWQSRLAKQSFVKLEVDERESRRGSPIVIRIGDVSIEVDAVLDVELLTAVVKAVRAAC